MNEVGALEVLPRPVIAKRRHPRGDELRKTRVERRVVEPQHLVERAAARVEQDVGAAEQAEHLVAAGRGFEVEHHRFLVAVVVPEEQRAFEPRLVLEERPDPPCGIAFGRFDLDDLGAEPGEQQPGILGALVGDLDHPQPGEHSGAGIAHHLARPGLTHARRAHFSHGASPSQRHGGSLTRRGHLGQTKAADGRHVQSAATARDVEPGRPHALSCFISSRIQSIS